MSLALSEFENSEIGNPADELPVPTQNLGAAPFIHALRRQWWRVLIAGVMLAVPAAVGVWHYLPLYHHVTTLLRVAGVEPRLVFATVDSQSRQDFEVYKQTQIQLIKARLVLNAALRNSQVSEMPIIQQQRDPIAWLKQKLQAVSPEDTEIISISLDLEDPEAAKIIVNEVAAAYMSEVVDVERNKRTATFARLDSLY